MGIFFDENLSPKYKDLVLNEAEDDQTTEAPATDAGTEEAPAPEESGEDATNDDFDIDTTLDDEDGGDDDGMGDDMGGTDDPDTSSTDTTTTGDEEDEPVEANTDMFASLSAEEQRIKISELKKQFGALYSSIDDTLVKINNTETDENNIEVVQKITDTLVTTKRYIMDYLTVHFPAKSFLENDIMYNRFLSIVFSISNVLEEMGKIMHKDDEDTKK